MAVLVMQAQGRVKYDAFLFCNVGADSENPATLDYVRDVARPYADLHGIPFYELSRVRRNGETETLYQRLVGDNRSIVIPVRMSNGAPGNRACTNDFKIRVVAKWLRQHGATNNNPAITGLGISLDEFHRARTDSGIPHQRLEYPLIDARMTVADCIKLIESAGLPVPPKSSCYFCPFKSRAEWVRMRENEPELFAKSVEIEKRINEKRGAIGRYIVYMHSSLKPLEQAVGEQPELGFDDNCESGYCFV